jgi:hypothetical protein
VFPEGGGVGVGLVTAAHLAVVRLVAGVHVRVLFPVARVGKPTVATIVLALERLLTWNEDRKGQSRNINWKKGDRNGLIEGKKLRNNFRNFQKGSKLGDWNFENSNRNLQT